MIVMLVKWLKVQGKRRSGGKERESEKKVIGKEK